MGEGESGAASSAPPEMKVEKDADGVYDLSAFMTPIFRYSLPELDAQGEPTGRQIKCNLAMDDIVLKLSIALPSAIRPAGNIEVDDPDNPGKKRSVPVVGLAKVLNTIQTGEKVDPSLPSVEEILSAVERAFQMPGGYGSSIKIAVLNAFLMETNRRAGLKKSTRGSRGSQKPTRGSSKRKASKRK